jgi:hypothetical protein
MLHHRRQQLFLDIRLAYFVTCSLVLPVAALGSKTSASVTLTVSVWVPALWLLVFQLVDALVPLVVWVLSTVLSTIKVKVFELPTAPITLALIDTVPLTVEPADGLVICTAGCTVIVSVGGLGSLSPKLSRVKTFTALSGKLAPWHFHANKAPQ